MSEPKGVWRHEDGSVCSQYPDSIDWTYTEPEVNPVWYCQHGLVMVCKHRPVTIEGKTMRLIRLDETGHPLHDQAVEIKSGTFDMTFPETEELHVIEDSPPELKRVTIDVTFKDMSIFDKRTLRLLTGGLLPRPWYWRWLPKFIRRTIKRREIRRGYGG